VLNTGALNYTVTDLTLPGKNGLDLVIKRRYDSTDATDYKFASRVIGDYTWTAVADRAQSRYPHPFMGLGWNLVIPWVVSGNVTKKPLYLYMGDGRTFKVASTIKNNKSDNNLQTVNRMDPLMFVDAIGCKPYTYSIGHPWDSNNLYSFVVTPGWYDYMKTGAGWLPKGLSLANPVHDGIVWGFTGLVEMDNDFLTAVISTGMDAASLTEFGEKWGLGRLGTAVNTFDTVSFLDYMSSAEYMIDQAVFYHIKGLNSNAFISTTREGAASKYNFVKDAIRPLVLNGELEVKSGSDLFGDGNNSWLYSYTYNNFADPLTGNRGTFSSDGFYFSKTDSGKDYNQWLRDLLNSLQ